ncbi:deaminase [Pleomorphomonas sp. JP5]|uniref:deaminase n=1 Tax=Pleomorphomonas sp. JP5 TaxID=2942998 RepID=UPI00204344C6|nr:nucleoside deaminase [Pleomorphomonas sp. JP5]MCM5558647.1 nucleoside deaminase [Pleomorphomonas sp. JP5]
MAGEQRERLVDALLTVIERHILPQTRKGIAAGNKVFGAALLDKRDYSLVLAGTNNETENPLWHGEVHTIKKFYEIKDRPCTSNLLFLSTHEPCSMCLSAITWAGFDNFFYFFSHEDSRDAFSIPHDLRILKEVFTLKPGGYRRTNAFWHSEHIPDLMAACDDSARAGFHARADAIRAEYARLSEIYQSSKAETAIPLK